MATKVKGDFITSDGQCKLLVLAGYDDSSITSVTVNYATSDE